MVHAEQASLPQTLVVGIIGVVVVLAIAAACIAPFTPIFFIEWVTIAFMAATPFQVIAGLVWQNSKPDFANSLHQPLKGLVLTAITILVGAVVTLFLVLVVGKNQGITAMLIHYTIMSIVATLWVVAIWNCWPFNKLSDDPVKIGIYTLIGSYAVAYLLWSVCFNYSTLAIAAPSSYYANLDPNGWFDMWDILIFSVTVVALIIAHSLFDFWPIERLSRGATQPVRGVVGTLYILVLSWGLRWFFTGPIGIPPVEYMIRVPVSLIFGTFVVSNMMQFSLFPKTAQPLRGLMLMFCATVMALVMYEVYALASTWHAGSKLGTGPENGFIKEIWMASAMLGVTFPIIFVVSGFFDFWPIKKKKITNS